MLNVNDTERDCSEIQDSGSEIEDLFYSSLNVLATLPISPGWAIYNIHKQPGNFNMFSFI